MTEQTKMNWELWHEERRRFHYRETEGFSQDIDALEEHIKILKDAAPKDKAGWIHNTALEVLNTLQEQLNHAKKVLAYSGS